MSHLEICECGQYKLFRVQTGPEPEASSSFMISNNTQYTSSNVRVYKYVSLYTIIHIMCLVLYILISEMLIMIKALLYESHYH